MDIGSGSAEGHHSRWQNHTLVGCAPKDIDKFANKLWEEDKKYADDINSPLLWADKKKEHEKDREKHLKNKRVALKHITGSRTTTHHASFPSPSLSSESLLWLKQRPLLPPQLLTLQS